MRIHIAGGAALVTGLYFGVFIYVDHLPCVLIESWYFDDHCRICLPQIASWMIIVLHSAQTWVMSWLSHVCVHPMMSWVVNIGFCSPFLFQSCYVCSSVWQHMLYHLQCQTPSIFSLKATATYRSDNLTTAMMINMISLSDDTSCTSSCAFKWWHLWGSLQVLIGPHIQQTVSCYASRINFPCAWRFSPRGINHFLQVADWHIKRKHQHVRQPSCALKHKPWLVLNLEHVNAQWMLFWLCRQISDHQWQDGVDDNQSMASYHYLPAFQFKSDAACNHPESNVGDSTPFQLNLSTSS